MKASFRAMFNIQALGLLLSTVAPAFTHYTLHAPQGLYQSPLGIGDWNSAVYAHAQRAPVHPFQQYSYYARQPSAVLPVKNFEVTSEDVSGGVSGFLHNSVSPNTAWYWVQGQKWKWNHIHSALHATGLQVLSQYAPYAPTWDHGVPLRPTNAGPVVQVVPLEAVVPGIGQFITGPPYAIHKKKK